ncbi:putative glutathione-independent glyoxalase [Clavispora lusitaniae]|uniref:D-lactate dehydratase n=3 Tax=Clavispora lusitaniae TaxID=36911 RepID=C4Y423_CLAL4|nr:uncharacterized protein CLUG_02395 [Clavispora lusitaniae ATCC 42720]KAF5211473.1 hypothetical protein E0198_002786 [Clavispora lusitaniae]EEQ38269.1 hypothetical protein CLUG_02395 [Clavispora lusitaniae ATCC 42720]KAF7580330.1 Glutathione-independent glyoxalase HSP31 [Clavispora lusitaniae]OVF05121.1 putative glyoxalase [Clavispora lusitaniae]QFZ27895.1 putative glutathione-independent glyoxalase [Clavispora lusitaniae]
MGKALIAITSYFGPFYDDGAKTGLFFVEALHPYETFTQKGYEVTFVSEDGTFGWDEHSVAEAFLPAGKDREIYEDKNSTFMKAISNVKKPSEVNADDYDIFFAAGGHGTTFDFPKASGLHELAAKIWSNNKVVAAVCHGPLIFSNLLVDGKPLIENKKVTGFTDEAEAIMKLDGTMKKYGLKTVKDIAQECGATYVEPADPWSSYTVTDGKLVTGVNPASAAECAEKSIAALN